MKEVESVMGVFQSLQRNPVLGAGPFVTPRPTGERDVRRDGKSEELPFRCTTPDARHPWIQELNDGPQHVIRREGVASMQPESTPAQAEHYGAVGVRQDSVDLRQSQLPESCWEPIFEQKTLLRRHNPWSPPATDTATFGAPLLPKENLSEGMNCRSAETQRKCWMWTELSSTTTRLNTEGRPPRCR